MAELSTRNLLDALGAVKLPEVERAQVQAKECSHGRLIGAIRNHTFTEWGFRVGQHFNFYSFGFVHN